MVTQVKIWFQNRRMKWKRGKKASLEARAKQHAAAAATTDKSKPEPETRKPEVTSERHAADAVIHVNNNATHSNDYGRRITETGNTGCKMAVMGSATGDLYARRPTSVIAFSVPPGKMADDQRACKSNVSSFGVMSLT